MDLFDWGRVLHSSVGTVALSAFWVAALATKGGRVHRRAGRVFLVALIGVMSLATLMVAARIRDGNPGGALFFTFLITMVATASWLTWFSVRRKRDPEG